MRIVALLVFGIVGKKLGLVATCPSYLETSTDSIMCDQNKKDSIRSAIEDSIMHRRDSIEQQDSIRNVQKNRNRQATKGQGNESSTQSGSTTSRRLGN